MPRKSPLTLPRPGVPDLHHPILTPRNQPQMISRECPNPLHVPEKRPHTSLRPRRVGVGQGIGGEHAEGDATSASARGVRVGEVVFVVAWRRGGGVGGGVEVDVPEADGGV